MIQVAVDGNDRGALPKARRRRCVGRRFFGLRDDGLIRVERQRGCMGKISTLRRGSAYPSTVVTARGGGEQDRFRQSECASVTTRLYPFAFFITMDLCSHLPAHNRPVLTSSRGVQLCIMSLCPPSTCTYVSAIAQASIATEHRCEHAQGHGVDRHDIYTYQILACSCSSPRWPSETTFPSSSLTTYNHILADLRVSIQEN